MWLGAVAKTDADGRRVVGSSAWNQSCIRVWRNMRAENESRGNQVVSTCRWEVVMMVVTVGVSNDRAEC